MKIAQSNYLGRCWRAESSPSFFFPFANITANLLRNEPASRLSHIRSCRRTPSQPSVPRPKRNPRHHLL